MIHLSENTAKHVGNGQCTRRTKKGEWKETGGMGCYNQEN